MPMLLPDLFGQSTGIRSVNEMFTDISETDNSYQIDMDLPGSSKDDIRAELSNGYLIVRASRTSQREEHMESRTYITKERYTGHYQRTFFVGHKITEEDIKARFRNGLLTLTIPKREEKPEVEGKKYIAIEG